MALDAGIGANSASSGGYDIDNSYKNENDNTERMYRAWGGITANTRTWTVSLWVKRTELGACYTWGAGTSGNDVLVVDFDSSDRLGFRSTKNAANDCVYRTNRVFRDTSAWYHLVFAVDTTSGTAGNRLRIYVNGAEETSFATETNFDQNDLTLHNANSSYMEVGSVIGESPRFNGYIAEVNSITGTQYAPTAFGEFDDDSGIWIPKKFGGSYAENSVFLEFKDSSSLGTDTSGNAQTFTLQNLTAADQSTDTPTNNFAIMNPLNPSGTYAEGATKVTSPTGTYGGDGTWTTSTIPISTGGKWYCEVKLISINASTYWQIGICKQARANSWNYTIMYRSDGLVLNPSGTGGNTTGNTTFAAGDIMGMAYDSSARTLKFYKNGTLVLTKTAGALTSAEDYFWGVGATSGGTFITDWNFGGYTASAISSAASDANGYGTFEYAPPTGYYALCTKNLAEYG